MSLNGPDFLKNIFYKNMLRNTCFKVITFWILISEFFRNFSLFLLKISLKNWCKELKISKKIKRLGLICGKHKSWTPKEPENQLKPHNKSIQRPQIFPLKHLEHPSILIFWTWISDKFFSGSSKILIIFLLRIRKFKLMNINWIKIFKIYRLLVVGTVFYISVINKNVRFGVAGCIELLGVVG